MSIASALFTHSQAQTYAWLFGQPGRSYHLSELRRLSGLQHQQKGSGVGDQHRNQPGQHRRKHVLHPLDPRRWARRGGQPIRGGEGYERAGR